MLLPSPPKAELLQAGDLLRLTVPSYPGTEFGGPIEAFEVLRFVGGRFHLDAKVTTLTKTVADIERGVALGKWEIEYRS